jgi:hypothetical protein
MVNKYNCYKEYKRWGNEVYESWVDTIAQVYPEQTLDDIPDEEIEITSELGLYLLDILSKYSTYEEYLAANR